MNQNLSLFLRGLLYSVIGGIINFVIVHLGASGIVSAPLAVVITGLLATLETQFVEPNTPVVPAVDAQQGVNTEVNTQG